MCGVCGADGKFSGWRLVTTSSLVRELERDIRVPKQRPGSDSAVVGASNDAWDASASAEDVLLNILDLILAREMTSSRVFGSRSSCVT